MSELNEIPYLAWGNGEPCPICKKEFKKADIEHILMHIKEKEQRK